MAVAQSIFTLDGVFQLVWAAFDRIFTVVPLTLRLCAPLAIRIGTKNIFDYFLGIFLYLDYYFHNHLSDLTARC